MIIEEIIKYNEEFVANKGYEKYLTSKYPDKKLAILSCMDTRLTELLPAALGLKNGDAKLIKNAGGLVISPFDSAMRSLLVAIYELGVEEIMVIAHSNCGACHMNGQQMKELMLKRGIHQDVIDTIGLCGIDLDHCPGVEHQQQYRRISPPQLDEQTASKQCGKYGEKGDADGVGVHQALKTILFFK